MPEGDGGGRKNFLGDLVDPGGTRTVVDHLDLGQRVRVLLPRDERFLLLLAPSDERFFRRPLVGPDSRGKPAGNAVGRLSVAPFRGRLREQLAEGGYGKPPDSLSRRFPTRIGTDERTPEKPLVGGGKQELEPFVAMKKDTNPLTEIEMVNNRPSPTRVGDVPQEVLPPATVALGHGDVLIAAITSCTNTSNPALMIGAALLAKKAVERGLSVPPYVKASFAPGSRVVTDYLSRAGLQPYLDRLGFHLVGYGCTTCIGNSGPLDPRVEEVVVGQDLIAASVLSGNRNFEARIQQSIKANFLMSPPLVVAFALAGRIDRDLTSEPIGRDDSGREVFLRDLWPSSREIAEAGRTAMNPDSYRRLYGRAAEENPLWNGIPARTGKVYAWDDSSTYIQEPPFFHKFSMTPGEVCDIKGARALAIFGDSVTTDHISPAGAIRKDSPAGRYLLERGVAPEDFNSYGSRRGNDRVMTRGTFANVRIRNLMVPGEEGGVTVYQPHGEKMSIYDAAIKYQAAGVPLVVFGGQEYGSGSSRDWAAKGTRLLGVRAVVAQSFERIHRSNLVGMGVLPCQFAEGAGVRTLGLDGTESFDLTGLEAGLRPRSEVTLTVRRANGEVEQVRLRTRIDTPIEVDYYRHGGILPYVLRELVA